MNASRKCVSVGVVYCEFENGWRVCLFDQGQKLAWQQVLGSRLFLAREIREHSTVFTLIFTYIFTKQRSIVNIFIKTACVLPIIIEFLSQHI